MDNRMEANRNQTKVKRNESGRRQQADKRRTEAQGKQAGCPLAKKCGGCQHSDMPYELQLKNKQKNVEKLLGSYGKIEKIKGMSSPYHYRNKVSAASLRSQRPIAVRASKRNERIVRFPRRIETN